MTTIKSHTDISQSKVLTEILPIESADMYYINGDTNKIIIKEWQNETHDEDDIPCWSLATLLDVLPDGTDIIKDKTDTENEKYMCAVGIKDDIISTFGNNSVDACYEMIIRLYELNLL